MDDLIRKREKEGEIKRNADIVFKIGNTIKDFVEKKKRVSVRQSAAVHDTGVYVELSLLNL